MTAYIRRSRRTALIAPLILFGIYDLLSRLGERSSPGLISTADIPLGRVFIASNHWNSAAIIQSHWADAVLGLIERLGPRNVYFSLYESGSWDDTKFMLQELDKRLGELGVARTIRLDETTHTDEIGRTPEDEDEGWIETKSGKKELRRIPYLAKLRNIVLEPLNWPEVNNGTHYFDKILFLNDVIFTPDDAIKLMQTRSGNYAAACALDFSIPHQFYDTFALRDSIGRPVASLEYPYFGAGQSRRSLLRGEPVPVRSCWNGMVSFDARPFLPPQSLHFRGIPDSLARHHLEGSECCLIHYDNPISAIYGIFLNPQVRVGYKEAAYEAAKSWPSTRDVVLGLLVRTGTWIVGLPWANRKVDAELRKWGSKEVGRDCLIDEMQVLVENGWKHM